MNGIQDNDSGNEEGIFPGSYYCFHLSVDEAFKTKLGSYFRSNPVFPDSCVFQLFRIFCMLGELVEDEQGRLEVREISSSTMTSFLDICDGSTLYS